MKRHSIKILFVTRKYPPSIGGMQKVNYELSKAFVKITPTKIVSWGGSQKYLPIIYPYLFIKALFLIPFFNPDVIYLGDGLLSPLGLLLKKIASKKVVCIVHGLDITFNSPLYQKIVPWVMDQLDLLICVSEQTKNECVKRGIKQNKVKVIPNGINPEEFKVKNKKNVREETLSKLSEQYNVDIKIKKNLLTVGRLVKRKGHEWFIRNVMPELAENIVYLIAGDGPEREAIEKVILEKNLQHRVLLLGKISNDLKRDLYNSVDLFIMPNISVPGDMEGFGIVALEAASAGLPTIASNIEGINDAVKNMVSGILVREKDTQEFAKQINKILKTQVKLSNLAKKHAENFSWSKIAKLHLESLSS